METSRGAGGTRKFATRRDYLGSRAAAMESSLNISKARLRAEMREVLASLPADQRHTGSGAACELLRSQPLWRDSRTLLLYAPTPDEVDIWPLFETALAAGKQILLPRYSTERGEYEVREIATKDEICVGRFGIREPSPKCRPLASNLLDLIMVPGIAFDLQGHRLGRGKGFYDRLLATLQGAKCGVAFDRQIVPELPIAPHDVVLHRILTPTRWHVVQPPARVLE